MSVCPGIPGQKVELVGLRASCKDFELQQNCPPFGLQISGTFNSYILVPKTNELIVQQAASL